MATVVQNLPQSIAPLTWLRQFLKEELAPYPGRAAVVGRMTIAATLVMIICMTFRIPYAFQGAVYALLISRESPRATLRSAAVTAMVTAIGAAYLLVSVQFVISVPEFHFLWVVTSLFLAFYVISAGTDYAAVVIFAIMMSIGVPLWDLHVPAEINVEDTLWLCLAVLVGVVITGAVELAFLRLRPGDEVVLPIAERLAAVKNLLTCYAESRAVDPTTQKRIIRLETLGTSLLRRILQRSDYSTQYSAEIAGVVVLVGRLVDLAATLSQLRFQLSVSDQTRFRNLASAVATMREDLLNRRIPRSIHLHDDGQPLSLVPVLAQMEYTVTLIPQAFADSRSIQEYLPSADDTQQRRLLALGALANPEHLQFALKGCLASTVCYVIYNAVAWPGISTAVTTCLLTALSNIGSSRQKQLLRITGAIIGGFLIGMGSQIFILPYIDSIAGFTILFIFVTAFASWIMTSTPRLSYMGVQVALAFYLINLSEFKVQTSLAVARDRVVGILLGLFIMWLVFDQFWGVSAAVQMKRTFISNLRLLAQFAREPLSKDRRTAISRRFALEEIINANFNKVRSLADGVLLEFGPSRERDLAWRSRIREWQPQLRTLFLMRIALWKYRVQLPGFELPEPVRLEQQEFDYKSAKALDDMAERLEGKASGQKDDFGDSFVQLQQTVRTCCSEEQQTLRTGGLQTVLVLSGNIESVTMSLSKGI
ncbi:MAG: multidrug resistance protein MdtO [Acidobacteriaceae bacterium]|jgi:multidrug resistance protein MdtO|nr:multidrug resistance protein MdtO [Acidobacteriaceae bacterium]